MTLITYIIIVSTLALAGFAAWSDWNRLKIPNAIPVSLCVLFLSAIVFQEFLLDQNIFYTSLTSQLLAALAVFTVTAVLFSVNAIGAGDAKLLSALALWTGFQGLPSLIFWMAFFGGVLAFAAIVIRRHKPFKNVAAGAWLDQLQKGRNAVPYGVAIFFGLIFAYGHMGYLDFMLINSGS